MSDPHSGGFDPRMFENVPLFRELAKVMSWTGGPVNWELAEQTAVSLVTPSAAELGDGADERSAAEFAQAAGTAELWLDQVTGLPRVTGPAGPLDLEAWVRLACSSEGLGLYVEPVARGMSEALERQLRGQDLGLPPELAGGGMAASMNQAMGAMGAMLYGVQIGTVAGHLAGQLVGTYDLGVPTVEPSTVGPVGGAARRFAADYEVDEMEFHHWLALRECAHRRQFGGVPWLRGHVSDLIRRFAVAADFDATSMLDQLGAANFDLMNPESLREMIDDPSGYRVEPTPEQDAVLVQLQALVSFTASWVDTVVAAAGGDKLPALERIQEAMLRRMAEQGPGEQFLQQLVGLNLKPTDVRAGRRFCDAVVEARGQEGLDRAWQRAEHLPRADELIDPSRWLVRMAAAELEEPEA